jgi:hypothetical protein
MNGGVPQSHESPLSDSFASCRRRAFRAPRNTLRAGAVLLGLCSSLLFASSAMAAAAAVGLGTAAPFSVLAGSTITNTGPTTMFGSLGLAPGSSVTGAPHVLGETHISDAVAIGAKNALTTAYNEAAGRPSNGSAGTDLSGQVFLPGVRTASSSLLLSSGSVTLDAQGNPAAVFIFQIPSTLITGSNTSVSLINGAQACNVFWQVGSSATLGTGTSFVGTIMANASITANTAATIHGRLLARTGAVTLETNTITNSNCASSPTGEGGGLETSPTAPAPGGSATAPVAGAVAPVASKTVANHGSTQSKAAKQRAAAAKRRAAARRAARLRAARRAAIRPALPNKKSSFTG